MKTTSGTLAGPLAAIDLGSNSFRLEIGGVRSGRYRRIHYLKEMVRLGAGLDEAGELTPQAIERALACLARFAQRLKGFEPGRVRAVATQTLREARNRNAFLRLAQVELGHPIEVISGREEARLIYAGVHHLQPGPQRRLVIDIGGRSTEMILGRGGTPELAESFQVGCVSLSMRHFPDGELGPDAFRAAQVAAGAELEEAFMAFSSPRWELALGASGTVGAVADVLAAAGRGQGGISADDLRWCITRCVAAGQVQRLRLEGLKPERAAVWPGGLAILYTLMTQLQIERLHSAKGALRQGVLVDLHARREAAQRRRPGDMRERTVAELQRRFGVDLEQARRVREHALAYHEAACPRLGDEQRRELTWAADLHEIGLMVSHHDHHRHSAYLLDHVDAAGFSQSEQRRIGALVLAQRGGLRKVQPQLDDEAYAWAVLCLRLAVIRCHARGEVGTDAWRLRRVDGNGRRARLEWDAAWALANPRTVYLLRQEVMAWERAGAMALELPQA